MTGSAFVGIRRLFPHVAKFSSYETLTLLTHSFWTNAILDGGEGNDILEGNSGNTTYVFDMNHGNDTIIDEGGYDIILFKNILKKDLIIERKENNLLLKNNKTKNKIILFNFLNNFHNQIEFINFTLQNQFLNISNLINNFITKIGTSKNDIIFGENVVDNIIEGLEGDDLIDGMGGKNRIYGGPGNDELKSSGDHSILYGGPGNDTLIARGSNIDLRGGPGNDSLRGESYQGNKIVMTGGEGDDVLEGNEYSSIYVFRMGDGMDVIRERGSEEGSVDVIRFAAPILPKEISLSREGFDLLLENTYSGDVIRVVDHFKHSRFQVERVEFADSNSTFWDGVFLAGEMSTKYGTSDDDVIVGDDVSSVIHGLHGNDVLYGGSGPANVIYGGDGDDQIYNGGGGLAQSGIPVLHRDDLIGGNSRLYGDDGDDVIVCWTRGAVLKGGDGNDVLKFEGYVYYGQSC